MPRGARSPTSKASTTDPWPRPPRRSSTCGHWMSPSRRSPPTRARSSGSLTIRARRGHDGNGGAPVLRIRHRRLPARGPRGQLAGRGVGPEQRVCKRDAVNRAPGGRGAALARRPFRVSPGHGRFLCHRCHHGELHRACRGASRRACPRRLERRGGRPDRRSAADGDRGRGSALHPLQVTRAAGAGPQAGCSRARGLAGAHARGESPPYQRAHDRLHAGRQREHGRL